MKIPSSILLPPSSPFLSIFFLQRIAVHLGLFYLVCNIAFVVFTAGRLRGSLLRGYNSSTSVLFHGSRRPWRYFRSCTTSYHDRTLIIVFPPPFFYIIQLPPLFIIRSYVPFTETVSINVTKHRCGASGNLYVSRRRFHRLVWFWCGIESYSIIKESSKYLFARLVRAGFPSASFSLVRYRRACPSSRRYPHLGCLRCRGSGEQ